jgi:multidrug efflux pump subunit AcrA (membrane-fusion protein)
MSETTSEAPVASEQRTYSGLLIGLLVIAVLAAFAGLVWSYSLAGRLTNAEAQVASAQAQNQKLAAALDQTNARLRVTSETLGHSLGLTQQQLDQRAQDLLRRQQAQARQLASEHAAVQQQIGAVSTDVNGVKTDVGGVKTDLNVTKTQLAAAQAQLQSMKGDLGIQSGLIATNANELNVLKHLGDRNYYEFTLAKHRRKAVATVALELKKADPRHSRFTVVVFSDDHQILKKDRSLDEPIQFYTGKNHLLYELVVNRIPNKNTIQGYIATPKNAPVPVTPSAE